MLMERDLPLTFATFYACGIKQFTNLTQRDCTNMLLKGNVELDSNDILSDSVCSNYVNGKKNLASDLRVALLSLSNAEVVNRLNKLNIQNYTFSSGALFNLVINSSLADNEKERLISYSKQNDELTFIAEVFLICIKGDNYYPLTQPVITTLESYRHSTILGNSANNSSHIYEQNAWKNSSLSSNHSTAVSNASENNEDFDWMRNYVPNSILNIPPAFIRSKAKITTVPLELPRDYCAMIYVLKPALTESAFETFTIDEFTKTMDIDTTHNIFKLQKGSLEYWQFEGAIDSILASLKRCNFSDVSDFAFQLIGEFTSRDVNILRQYLNDISNENVNILTSLIIDKEPLNVNLTLIAHKCDEKVEDQKADKDHDGTHNYTLRRSPVSDYKS
ncbi:MAG: hypothetical protein NC429_14595 [Lachnospiraceae bacterium]|nr:hypothetical protein [Lachnospiraceae bacterium]